MTHTHTCWCADDPMRRKFRALTSNILLSMLYMESNQMWMCLQQQRSLLYMFFMSPLYNLPELPYRFLDAAQIRRSLCARFTYGVPPKLIYFSSLVTIKLFIWCVYSRSECFECAKKNRRERIGEFYAWISFHIRWWWKKPVVTYGLWCNKSTSSKELISSN